MVGAQASTRFFLVVSGASNFSRVSIEGEARWLADSWDERKLYGMGGRFTRGMHGKRARDVMPVKGMCRP
jgi:hypothetical protein